MAKESKDGSFSGFNIETIEKDLSLQIPVAGDNKDKPGEEPGKGTKMKFPDLSQKIAIPETPEEIQTASGQPGIKVEKKGGSHEEEDIPEGSGAEDAIIKEDSPHYLYAATLHEEGILPTLDLNGLKGKKFKEGVQVIIDAQKKYIEDGRSEYQNSLTDRQKEFLEMIELGIPQEQVEHQFVIEDSYGKITDQVLSADVELQKGIITQNFKLKGIPDTKIQVLINAAEEKEKLFEEAKEALTDINAYIAEQKQASIDAAKNAQTEADNNEKNLQKKIKETIDTTEEIFPGMKISAKEKTDLYNYMTKPVEEKVIKGKKVPIDIISKTRMEDPIAFNLRTAYYIMLGLYDKKTDLSKFIKKTTTTASERLAAKLKEESIEASQGGLKVEKDTSGKKTKVIFPQF